MPCSKETHQDCLKVLGVCSLVVSAIAVIMMFCVLFPVAFCYDFATVDNPLYDVARPTADGAGGEHALMIPKHIDGEAFATAGVVAISLAGAGMLAGLVAGPDPLGWLPLVSVIIFLVFLIPFIMTYGHWCYDMKIGETAEGYAQHANLWELTLNENTMDTFKAWAVEYPASQIAIVFDGDPPEGAITTEEVANLLTHPEQAHTGIDDLTIDDEGKATVKIDFQGAEEVTINGQTLQGPVNEVTFTQVEGGEWSSWKVEFLDVDGEMQTEVIHPDTPKYLTADEITENNKLEAKANEAAADNRAEGGVYQQEWERVEPKAEEGGTGEQTPEERLEAAQKELEAAQREVDAAKTEATRRLLDQTDRSFTDKRILLLVPLTFILAWLFYAIRKRYKRYVRPKLHHLQQVVVHMSSGHVHLLYTKQCHE